MTTSLTHASFLCFDDKRQKTLHSYNPCTSTSFCVLVHQYQFLYNPYLLLYVVIMTWITLPSFCVMSLLPQLLQGKSIPRLGSLDHIETGSGDREGRASGDCDDEDGCSGSGGGEGRRTFPRIAKRKSLTANNV